LANFFSSSVIKKKTMRPYWWPVTEHQASIHLKRGRIRANRVSTSSYRLIHLVLIEAGYLQSLGWASPTWGKHRNSHLVFCPGHNNLKSPDLVLSLAIIHQTFWFKNVLWRLRSIPAKVIMLQPSPYSTVQYLCTLLQIKVIHSMLLVEKSPVFRSSLNRLRVGGSCSRTPFF